MVRIATMKLAATKWIHILPAVLVLTSGAPGAAAALSPLFTLDTRGSGGGHSALFTLDTRDPDVGTVSGMFSLDTRGDPDPVSGLFTLDTRGLELAYAPHNLTVVPEQLTVARVTWDYFGTPLGFLLQRRAPHGEWDSTTESAGSIRAYADTAVLPGHFYEYRIAAVLPEGVSEFSELAYIQMPTLPEAPLALRAEVTGDGQVRLSWQDQSDNEQGFDVWRQEGPAGDWSSVIQVGANVTTGLDTTVAPATFYTYKVRATNEWGNSGFSEVASVMTPDPGTGCGYLLQVEDIDLLLDGVAVNPGMLNQAGIRALLQGELQAWIRSPPGNPHPVRIVLGFRDGSGAAAGQPVELLEFYRVPGCPGVSVLATVPESFRAPAAGTNTLWLEMIMAQRDPVEAFMTERHVQESPMRKRLFDVAIRPADAGPVRVRMLDVAAAAGGIVDVPVQMISAGGEDHLAFSVTHDTSLQWLEAIPGADLPQAWLQDNQGPPGSIGLDVRAPLENPFGAGAKHVVTLRFHAEHAGAYPLQFQDVPVARAINDAAPGPGVTWEGSLIQVFDAGLEGDVFPDPGGDGVVDRHDAHAALLVALGVMPVPPNGAAFQRMDCAPLATCGDGRIDIRDKVAILRYAHGQEALCPACGPTNLLEAGAASAVPAGKAPRAVWLDVPADILRGESFWLPMRLAASGNEHALAASLAFDAEVLAYQGLSLSGPATNGVFLPNLEAAAEGAIGFGMTLADGETYAAGEPVVVEVRFTALEGNGSLTTLVAFAQTPAECRVTGLNSELLTASFAGAPVVIREQLDAAAPPAPASGQAIAISMHQIRVSWTPAAWAAGYRIRRRLDGESVWTRLADFEATRTVFVDAGLPPDTTGHYLITALTPQNDESAAVSVSARTWTTLESWREKWLGQVANTGFAADDEDPDEDGIPNLLEHQLGTDPMVPDAFPFRFGFEELFPGTRSLTLLYEVLQGAPGQVTIEFTADLRLPDSWGNTGLAPVSRRLQGAGEVVKVRLPDAVSGGRMLFLRMKTE